MSQLSLLLNLVGSRMKAQEFLFLIKDKRRVIRQGYYDTEIKLIVVLCNELGLHVVKSTFAVRLKENGFANKGERSSEGMCFYYISKNQNQAICARDAESADNHAKLGELLGYPQCCITYFNGIFSPQNTNPQHSPNRWETNITLRPKDWCILSHFPCTNDCQKSIVLANNFFAQIELDNSLWAKELKTNLESYKVNG